MEDILDAIGGYLVEVFEGFEYEGYRYKGPSAGYNFALRDENGDYYLVRFTSDFIHQFNPHSIIQALKDYGVVRTMQENTNTLVRVSTHGVEIWRDDD